MFKVHLGQDTYGEFQHIKALLDDLVAVKERGGMSLWMFGGHIPKVGCSKYIVKLYRGGYITNVAVNGSCAIHDFELCMRGMTSEDIWGADFGMQGDSHKIYSMMLDTGGLPLGISLRGHLKTKSVDFPDAQLEYYTSESILANTPSTIHSFLQIDMPSVWALATDVKKYTVASWMDFEKFTHNVGHIQKGIVVNVGSAVQMPGLFLKGTARARRMGYAFDDNYSAYNLDMIQHYNANRLHPVKVTRLTGYHEVLLPLICQELGV